MSVATKMKLLLVGLDEGTCRLVSQLIGDAECRSLRTADDLSVFLDDPVASQYQLAVAGAEMTGVSTIELAQSIRSVLVEAPILFCLGTGAGEFDRGSFIKNGFSEAFLLPFETETFRNVVTEMVAKVRKTKHFKPVRVIDLQLDVALDFDLHVLLPQNKKYVRFASAGDPLDAAKAGKLKTHQVGSIYVPTEQMPRFYDYSAKALASLAAGVGPLSETERRERLQSAVRDLVTDIFTTGSSSFEDGKQLASDATKIVETFVKQTPMGEWYSKVLKTLGDSGDSYSHLSSVSAIAALFSMGLGVGKPEELAIAGLFHDLGLAMVPSEIQAKPSGEWTPEEKARYRKHPEFALTMMKEKRIVISDAIQTIILQHHERHSGNGFPAGLIEPKLKRESQVLGLADEFEYLTRTIPGSPRLQPREAIEKIIRDGGFHPDFHKKLRELFAGAEAEPSSKEEAA